MTGISVAELLQLDTLQDLQLLAGSSGTDRIVTEVSVLEVPRSVEQFVRGGEFILTTMYGLQDDPQGQIEIIKAMAERGAAGLAFHPYVHGDPPSAAVLEAADALDFPVVLMPPTMPYADVLTAVLGAVLAKQSLILKKSDEINREMTRLILQGDGVEAIATVCSRLTNQPILITDEQLQPLATGVTSSRQQRLLEACTQSPEFAESLQALRVARTEMSRTGESMSFKVRVDGRWITQVVTQAVVQADVYGYIFAWESGEPLQELDFIALSHAATALALEQVKERAVQESENRIRSDFLSEVLAGQFADEDELVRRGRLMHIDLSNKRIIMLFRLEQDANASGAAAPNQWTFPRVEHYVQRLLQRVVADECPRSLVMPRGETLLGLLHFDRPTDREAASERARLLAARCQQQLAEQLPGLRLSIGIGGYYDSALELGQSYWDATRALDVGSRLHGPGLIASAYDLGVFGVLGKSSQSAIEGYVKRVLHAFIDYDEKNNTDLVNTLEVYLDEKESLVATAKRLFVHPNTVRYRIEKVREIAGAHVLDHAEQRLNLHLALKCRRLL